MYVHQAMTRLATVLNLEMTETQRGKNYLRL